MVTACGRERIQNVSGCNITKGTAEGEVRNTNSREKGEKKSGNDER